MEQKQLDELDESFFSEEFIDDEPLDVTKSVSSAAKEKVDKRNLKKVKVLKNSKEAAQTIREDNQFEVDFDSLEEEKEEIQIKPAKIKEAVKSKEINTGKSSSKAPVETSSPVNPWANDEKKESNFFQESSNWKVIAGILVVLLVFSIVTGGFQFSERSNPSSSELTLSEAQDKTLAYVNDNLLRPPFVAQVKNISEANKIYKVSLAVADQNFDTYITKDGKYIFLQGFDTSISLKEPIKATEKETAVETAAKVNPSPKSDAIDTSSAKPNGASTSTTANSQKTATSSTSTKEAINSSNTPSAKAITVTSTTTPSSQAAPTVSTGQKKELTLTAKKWFFSPSKLTLNKGDKIILTIIPENIDFTFTIPQLNVEKEVKGKTTVEFIAGQSGSFDYNCGSCEDYRGMTGTLIVE